MKSFVGAFFTFVLCLFLFACTQNESQKTATAVHPTATETRANIETKPATFILPSPQSAINMTPIVITPIPQSPSTTQLPDFEPTQIPGLLQSALTMETLSGFNGQNMQRISGWKYGFSTLDWLGANHIMLYPYAGVTSALDTRVAGIYPAVVNLNSEEFWIPYLSQAIINKINRRETFSWSAQLGVLIIPGPNNEVNVYSPDGELRNSYPGSLLGVSPSATKLLIDNGTWLDLSNGKAVDFAWQQTYPATDFATFAYSWGFHPIWSSDEMRVYSCCYLYGNAKTSTSYSMPYNEITIDGKKVDNYFSLQHFGGIWVLGDTYLLPSWGGALDGSPNFIPLFDPAARTYRNLSAMLGLPYSIENLPMPYCNRPSAHPGGRYVWVDCLDGGHLIDLANFRSRVYPPPADYSYEQGNSFTLNTEWSADGTYLLVGRSILSVATGEMKPLPKDCNDLSWHSKDDVIACLSIDSQSLLLIDSKTVSIQKEIILPIEFQELIWSPEGKHIALLARDSSLWQVDYPKLENLEQLTAATPEWTHRRYSTTINESLVKNILWSPDGMSLAFIGGADVYVVDTHTTP